MHSDFLTFLRRLEVAQGLHNERFNQAAGGRSLPVAGGFAHWRGPGHPLNQALGLVEALSQDDLQELESFLGDPTVLELSPAADPGLWPLLAQRGYRLQQFIQLLARPLDGGTPPGAAGDIRVATPDQEDLFSRLVGACFMDRDDWRDQEPPFVASLEVPEAWAFLAFVGEEPAGGGMLGLVDGVALFSGDGVLPRFRGRGLQKALIRARLAWAGARGCDTACASTLPGTPSQRAYEACGFRVAYPKVEMARGGG